MAADDDKLLTIAERPPAQTPPNPFGPGVLIPGPQVSGNLTVEERSLIAARNERPVDYASVLLPSTAVGMGFDQLPDGTRVMVMQVMIVVPGDLVPPASSAILDPKTQQPMLAKRLAQALPDGWPALTRFLMRREAFAKPIQAQLQDADARLAMAQAMFEQNKGKGDA